MTPRPGQRRSRLLGALATLTAAALALSACAGGGSPTPANPSGSPTGSAATTGGKIDPSATIEAGISYPLGGSFDPMVASGAVTMAANRHIFEGLTRMDQVTGQLTPDLATEMPKKVDDTTYEVTLRKDAKFHDGSPVTAADVVFSFQRILDPKSGTFFRSFIDFIDTVEAVNDTQVRFKLKRPFSLVSERFTVIQIVPKKIVEADADAFAKLPTGSGPYKLISAVPDDKLVFERFADYNGPLKAQAAGMKWNLLADSAARVTAMTSGTIQAMEDVPYIDVPSLQNNKALKVEMAQSFGLAFMMFNTTKKPFDDVRVRQAFFYALDMDKIIKTGLLGNAEAATSFLPKSYPNYNQASTVYKYDPEKAKALLKEAGVSNLKINLMTTDTRWLADIAPLFKEAFDAVGISTTLDIGQSAGQYTKVDAGDMDVMIAPGDPSVFGRDPDVLMRWWFGDNVWPKDRYRWSASPEYAKLTKLLDEAVVLSGAEQQAKWNEAFNLLSEQVPLYPLFHRQIFTAWNPSVIEGFSAIPVTGLDFLKAGILTR